MIFSLVMALQAAEPADPPTEEEADLCSYANCYGSRIRRPELDEVPVAIEAPLPGFCKSEDPPRDIMFCVNYHYTVVKRKLSYADRQYLRHQNRHGGKLFQRVDQEFYEENYRAERDAWYAYRDSSCRRAEMEYPDRRAEGLRELLCKLWMSEERLEELEQVIGRVNYAE